ncbi:MAG: transcriptional regulator, TetR family [Bryobacterales bacterium]|nr:transcriptional regulator, TetR family [Bryobacterales bacterium]
MDAIAAEAGVSKATVYKHWQNKDALLVDAIRDQSLQMPAFDSGNTRQDLLDLLTHLAHNTKSDELAKIWPRIMSYAATNSPFAKVLHERLFDRRRERLVAMLDKAAEAGELVPGIEPDLAADLLIGPIMHRRFITNNNVPKDLPKKVVEAFYRAFRPKE